MRMFFINMGLVLVLVTGLTFDIFSQDSLENNENIELITDRDLYLSGELIWYVASLTNNNKQFESSKVIYMELFDNEGNLLASQSVIISDGISKGAIRIPHFTKTGFSILRAYTRFQNNFPVWQMESKVVKVVNANFPLPRYEKQSVEFVSSQMNDGRLSFRLPVDYINDSAEVSLFAGDQIVDSAVVIYSNGLGYSDYLIEEKNNLSLELINSDDTIRLPFKEPVKKKVSLSTTLSQGKLGITLMHNQGINQNVVVELVNLGDDSRLTYNTIFVDGLAAVIVDVINIGTGTFSLKVLTNGMKPIEKFLIYIPTTANAENHISLSNNDQVSSINSVIKNMEDSEFPVVATVAISGSISNISSNTLPNYIINNPTLFG